MCFTLIFDIFYFVGWPKFHVRNRSYCRLQFILDCFLFHYQLQVWHQDVYGRNELYSYGFCHIPISPGSHEIECVTWRPKGTLIEELKTQFIGGSSQLKVSLRKTEIKQLL